MYDECLSYLILLSIDSIRDGSKDIETGADLGQQLGGSN